MSVERPFQKQRREETVFHGGGVAVELPFMQRLGSAVRSIKRLRIQNVGEKLRARNFMRLENAHDSASNLFPGVIALG